MNTNSLFEQAICTTVLVLNLAISCLAVKAQDADPKKVVTLKGHGDVVQALAFSPNGKVLTSGGADAQVISWNLDGIVQEVEVKGKDPEGIPSAIWEINRTKVSDRIADVAYSANGRFFAASGVTRWGNGYGTSLQISTPFRPEPFKMGAKAEGSYTSIAFSPTGEFLAMGAKNNELKVVRILAKPSKDGKVEQNLVAKTAPNIPNEVWRVAYHPKKPMVAAGGKDGWIRLYSMNLNGLQREVLAQEPSHGSVGGITGLQFTSAGTALVSTASDGKLKVFSMASGETLHDHQPANFEPRMLKLHPTKDWAILAYSDGKARIIDYLTGLLIAELPGHEGNVNAVAFSNDGVYAATGGQDHLIHIWNLGIKEKRIASRKKRR